MFEKQEGNTVIPSYFLSKTAKTTEKLLKKEPGGGITY